MKKFARIISLALALVLAMSLAACGGTESAEQSGAAGFTGEYIVSPQYIIDNIDNDGVIFVDARGEDAAKGGTVKGAIAVVWQMFATCADGAPGDVMWGTILDTERLSAALSACGLDPNKEIILFGAAQNGWGDDGRILWELVAAGYPNVKMADRSFDALAAAGVPTQKGAEAYTPCEVTVKAIDETHVINTDALVADYDSFKILDVRADEEFEGQVLYGEAQGGHLPGAIHLKYTDLFTEDGVLKTNEEIVAFAEAAGLQKSDKLVSYCTAGIRSAYMQLVLEMCGYEHTMNYDESFYRWAACQNVE